MSAENLRQLEAAKVEAEQQRISIYAQLPQHVLMGLALRELAGNLPEIQQLNLTPDLLSQVLGRWAKK